MFVYLLIVRPLAAFMIKFVHLVLLLSLSGFLTGCLTERVLDASENWNVTHHKTDADGTRYAEQPSINCAYYLLLPVSVPCDVALSPIYLAVILIDPPSPH